MNPLLQDFNTAPFSKISNKDYKPAIKKGIEIAKLEIEAIIQNADKPTFKNTTVALDFSGEKLHRITSVFFNLNSAETNDEIQEIAQEVSPWLSEFGNDITLNTALFERVKAVFNTKETKTPDTTSKSTSAQDQKLNDAEVKIDKLTQMVKDLHAAKIKSKTDE